MASTRSDGIVANAGPPRRRAVTSVVVTALPVAPPPATTAAAAIAEATAVAGPSSPQRAVIGTTGVLAPA
ncbi:hypothetical protein ACWDUI_35190 [Streptosporangium sandarakinum]|uniref:hypothetical protein n=1 Tax=Streptosporangium sandarakinum TaxID=1260955 RepID=UPI0036994F57